MGTARINAIATWLLEVSVLLAVFPWLDQALDSSKPFNWKILFWSWILMLLFLGLGVYCIRDKK
jgi:quinol-cytochrome oxidoreductase complex cytochrome b subunit